MSSSLTTRRAPVRGGNGYAAARTSVTRLARLGMGALYQASYASGAPIIGIFEKVDESPDPASPSLWLYGLVAIILVLLGGVFAGLTIA